MQLMRQKSLHFLIKRILNSLIHSHLAIRREPLARHARVNGHLGRLPAERTGNGFANFHAQNLTARGQSANVQLF